MLAALACYIAQFENEGGEKMKISDSLKKKLSSRKFWSAIIGVAVSLMAMFGIDDMTAGQITGLISAVSVLVAYIFAEGFIDANS